MGALPELIVINDNGGGGWMKQCCGREFWVEWERFGGFWLSYGSEILSWRDSCGVAPSSPRGREGNFRRLRFLRNDRLTLRCLLFLRQGFFDRFFAKTFSLSFCPALRKRGHETEARLQNPDGPGE